MAMVWRAQITVTSAPIACVKATSNHRCYSGLGEAGRTQRLWGGTPGLPVVLHGPSVPSRGLPSWHKGSEAEEWPSSHQPASGIYPMLGCPMRSQLLGGGT